MIVELKEESEPILEYEYDNDDDVEIVVEGDIIVTQDDNDDGILNAIMTTDPERQGH